MINLEKETKEFFERIGWAYSFGCWRKINSITNEADTENIMSERDAQQIAKAMLIRETRAIRDTLNNIPLQHYGYGGKLEDTRYESDVRMRPGREEPGYCLSVAEAREYFNEKLKELEKWQKMK